MSLRWSSYIAPKPSKGAKKCKTAVFGVKSHFTWGKSASVLFCETYQWQSCKACKALIGLTIRAKMIGDSWNVGLSWPHLSEIANLQWSGGGGADPKFQVEGVTPTIHSQQTRLNDLSYGIKMWTGHSSVLSQCTRLTDGRTDRILITRPRVHSMQRGKNLG